MTIDTPMSEEGFVVRALSLAIADADLQASLVCKQDLFNGASSDEVNPTAKAYTIVSMDIFQAKCVGVNLVGPVVDATNAKTCGELQVAIAEAINILSSRNTGGY
ncbi:hypothetical protein ACT3UM_02520 [Halomonas sp. AOP13-D3-9]